MKQTNTIQDAATKAHDFLWTVSYVGLTYGNRNECLRVARIFGKARTSRNLRSAYASLQRTLSKRELDGTKAAAKRAAYILDKVSAIIFGTF